MDLRNVLGKVGVCVLVVLAGVGAAQAATTKTINVDCTRGDSINAALADKAEVLVVEVRGTCVEDVVVRRRNVTLHGSSATTDGIEAATPTNLEGAAVLLDDADQVVLENLTLSGGGREGLRLQESGPTITVRNCRFEGNRTYGVAAFNSAVELEDVVVSGNGSPCSTDPTGGGVGIGSFFSSSLTCTRCTVTDNDGGESGCDVGVQTTRASTVVMQDSTVSGDPAVFATTAARLFAIDSTLIGTPFADDCSEFAAFSSQHGQLTVQGGTIAGGLLADLKSVLILRRSVATGQPAQQTVNNCENQVTRDSMLDVAQGASLLGTTSFDSFSQGFFRGAAAAGDLNCIGASDAICRAGAVATSSNCASCPVP